MDDEFDDFGGIDIDDIPESIARGKYLCELSGVNLRELKKEEIDVALGHKMWVFDFRVTQPNSDYVGESSSVFLHLYTSKGLKRDPESKQILLNGEYLDATIQDDIRKAIKFHRNFVKNLGFEKGVPVDFASLEGREFFVTMYPDSSNKTRISQNDPIVPAEQENSQLDEIEI